MTTKTQTHMIDVQNGWGWQKIEEFGVVMRNNQLVNTQAIKEQLLRLAVKWCDNYASDIIYLVSSFEQKFLEEGISQIDIYFRRMGINWTYNTGKGDNIPEKYRGVATLIFSAKNNDSLTLYWKGGNC